MSWAVSRRVSRGLGVLGLAACLTSFGLRAETLFPRKPATTDVPSAGKFPHARLGVLLDRIVSDDGLVDYAALEKDDTILDEYLAEIARVSPVSNPPLFPIEEDVVSYWINVHNACALRAVLHFRRPKTLEGLEHKFDVSTDFIVGHKSMSLRAIENTVLKTFADPRILFALVAARRGGPPLAKEPWEAATLDKRLDKAARLFVGDSKNVAWTPPSTEAGISRIILSHRSVLEREAPSTVSGDARLVLELNRWRTPKDALLVSRVKPLPVDERLNDVSNR